VKNAVSVMRRRSREAVDAGGRASHMRVYAFVSDHAVHMMRDHELKTRLMYIALLSSALTAQDPDVVEQMNELEKSLGAAA
jgi:hypothetical protein